LNPAISGELIGKKKPGNHCKWFRVRDQHKGWFMSMYRIVGQQIINGKKVGGLLMQGDPVPDAWDLSVFEVNGHREVSARPVIAWTELCEAEDHLRDWPDKRSKAEIAYDEQLRKERSLKKAAQRAQSKCRRSIKAGNFREMLTGTYRENQTDLELFKAHLTRFIEAMQYVLPKWQYCLSFEKQERGAYHFHCATTKLPRFVRYKGEKIEGWTLPTLIWRSIVGQDNGLVFVGGKPRWGSSRRRNQSLGKIASYVSKYIMKDYADHPLGSKRYWVSRGVEIPAPVRERIYDVTIDELVRRAFQTNPAGSVIVSHRIGHFGDSYWLCTEPASRPSLH
jgi:hypothetical protein